MFKKLSVFVDANLRRWAEKNQWFIASPAFRTALGLPAEIITLDFCSDDALPRPGSAKSLGKFADGHHVESKWLRNAIREAYRIEAVLKPWCDGEIEVEMKFFAKAAKVPHFTLCPHIRPNGEIYVTSCSMP